LDLDGAVVTFDALHTVRANPAWLGTDKKAHYIAIVKRNQPLLHAQIRTLPWRQVPAGISARETRRGRAETPHPEGRSRQPPGLPRLPPGRRDHTTPPKPSASTASIRTETDIHGTRRSPEPPGRFTIRDQQ
jgi:hypothetical protein